MSPTEKDGRPPPKTAKTPAAERPSHNPPRTSAPGPSVVLAPDRHMKSSLKLPHPGHPVDRGTQSATRSSTLPTMSETPQLDWQFVRSPVLDGPLELVLQSSAPGVLPGSGVPAAARCHSWFVKSRFPESAHASSAWNQVVHAVGSTPGIETAYTPGDGGLEPKTGVQLPSAGKPAG